MGSEREAGGPPEGCGYLRGILEDGARPFVFRHGVRSLLGIIDGGAVAGNIPLTISRSGFLPPTDKRSTRAGLGPLPAGEYGQNAAGLTDREYLGGTHIVSTSEYQESHRSLSISGSGGKTVKALSGVTEVSQPEAISSNWSQEVITGRAVKEGDGGELLEHRYRIQRHRTGVLEVVDASSAGATGSANRESETGSAAEPKSAGTFELLDEAGFYPPGPESATVARENAAAGLSWQETVPNSGEDGKSAPPSAIAIPGVTGWKTEYRLDAIDPTELDRPAAPPDLPENISSTGDSVSPVIGQATRVLPGSGNHYVTPRPEPDVPVSHPSSRQAEALSGCGEKHESLAAAPRPASHSDNTPNGRSVASRPDTATDRLIETRVPLPPAGTAAQENRPGDGMRPPATDHRTTDGANGISGEIPSGIPSSGFGPGIEASGKRRINMAVEKESDSGSSQERARCSLERLLQASRSCTANPPDAANPAGYGQGAEPADGMPMPQNERVVVITRTARRSAEPAAFWERSSLARSHLRPLR